MNAAGTGDAKDLRLALALDGALADVLGLLDVRGLGADEMRLGAVPSGGDVPAIVPHGVALLLADPWDVPALVACGGADAGIAPKHVLAEVAADLVEVLDLGVGEERLVYVAAGEKQPPAARRLRIATAHPRLTRRHFARTGRQVDTLELRSVAEAAALTGAADGAVLPLSPDARATAGGLAVLSEVLRSSSRLVVNRSARVVRAADLAALVERLRAETVERASRGVGSC
jgi:ATP phosphoribosyltransferase regulatory subunit